MFFYSLRVFYKGATRSKEELTKDFIRLTEQMLDIFNKASYNNFYVRSVLSSS